MDGWVKPQEFDDLLRDAKSDGPSVVASIIVRRTGGDTVIWAQDGVDQKMRAIPLPAQVFDELAKAISHNYYQGQNVVRCWPYVFTRSVGLPMPPAEQANEGKLDLVLDRIETLKTAILGMLASPSKEPTPDRRPTVSERARTALMDSGVRQADPFASGRIPCVCGEAGCEIVWHKPGRGPIVAGATGHCGFTLSEMDGWHDPEAKRV